VATQWYFPHKLPLAYGLRYWGEVFKPTSDAFTALGTSIVIAVITVILCLVLPCRLAMRCRGARLPWRGAILLILLLPQAFRAGDLFQLADCSTCRAQRHDRRRRPGAFGAWLVIAVWIAAAAFAAVDSELEIAARTLALGIAYRARGDIAAGDAGPRRQRDLVFLESLRRVHRHVFCRGGPT